MKTAVAKISTTANKHIQKKAGQPFFNKEGQGGFFSKSNKTSASFFSPNTLQPKLIVGQTNDKYEMEADAMADKVVQNFRNTESDTIQTKCADCKEEKNLQKKEEPLATGITPIQQRPIFESYGELRDDSLQTKPMGIPAIQTKCTSCKDEEKLQKKEDETIEKEMELHKKVNFTTNPEPPDEENIQTKSESQPNGTLELERQLSSSRGGGNALAPELQDSMGSAFGADFSDVRVYTDNNAVQMNNTLNAQAFTHGNDIYFNQGKYRPETSSGKHLLAHELVHTVQQGKVRGSERTVQRGLWDDIKSVASDVGGVISSGASTVGNAISTGVSTVGNSIVSGVSAIGGALGSAWSVASTFLGNTASWAYEGLKSLGSTTLDWLSTAGSHVWSAIRWLGSRAWEGIKLLGTFLWEKLAVIGTNLWSYLSNIPVRFWRTIVHKWEGIKGVLSCSWDGLRSAAGHVWNGLVGIFHWLGEGLDGAINWLLIGVQSGLNWSLDFIQDPSLSKLWNALTGSLSWAWEGLKGFGQWGWNGVVAAATWVREGARGFGSWLWDGFVREGEWVGRLLLYVLDLIGFWEALQIMWGVIFRLRKLTDPEIEASKSVHPPGMIPYNLIRVDEGSWVARISGYFSGGGYRAVTTTHILHVAPGESLHTMVHELSHVAQYEQVGSVYMAEAIHAQAFGAGYDYTDSSGALLETHFWKFNREQQASICEDYYIAGADNSTSSTGLLLRPLIKEMRAGKF